jgi:two-component system phosphate regulon sensor histidine kinase PhoR
LVRDPKLEELLARKSRIESIAATESPSPESVHNKQPDIGIEIGSNINPEQVLNIKSIPYTNELRMIVARDVTRLINVNRMHSDFVANVSHELKTPLTVLKGYLEILQNKPDLEPSWIKPLQQMSLQSDRMQLLVQDLLFLSKLEDRASRPRVSEVDVLQLINTITEMTQSEVAAKSHSLTLQIDQTINILGQKNELQSAFTNLIINAINYTHDGGSILIDWRQDNQCARLTVKDTGQGIPRHHIPRLTERFYRIDPDRSRAGGGTGLGLAIVKHVLQRHDASLEIESKEGKGSSFSCVFPMSRIIQRSIEHESLA